jgi:hypothetical protein
MTVEPLILTQSTIKEWTRCPRKWWLSQYRRLVKAEEYRSPTTVGNLVHLALDAYYSDRTDPLERIRTEAERLLAEHPDDERAILKDVELAAIMVEGYVEWLQETGADYNLEVIEPERAVEVDIGELPSGRTVRLRGKLDGKVKTRDRFVAFLETKTVGNFVDLPSFAQRDRQLLTYHLLEYMEVLEREGRDALPKTDGAILNMLRKVKRTDRAKPPFYQREFIRHNVTELRSHWKHVMAVAERIDDAERRLDAGEDHHRVVPPVPTSSCRWECPFNVICGLFDDSSDVEELIPTLYDVGDPLARYREEEVETSDH